MAGLLDAFVSWVNGTTPVKVEPGMATVWKVQHLDRCRIFDGAFVVYDSAGRIVCEVAGRIVEWPGMPAEVFIRDPPSKLRAHSKGSCLQLLEPNSPWFKVHWDKPAVTWDAGRAYVEQLLAEAIVTPAS